MTSSYRMSNDGLRYDFFFEGETHLCQIDCRFVKYSDGTVGFAAEGYNTAQALVIDS
jgi:hypothetical protein